jgi:hypothetical protein
MSKPNHKVKKSKIKRDGVAIASVEKAVHNLKGTVHDTTRRSSKSAFSTLPKLLGDTELQEAAWLMAVSNCRDFAARIPVSQVTGVVPVDLFRKTVTCELTTNASNAGFFMAMSDAWQNYILSSDAYGILGADTNANSYATVSDASWLSGALPGQGIPLPLGTQAALIGDVSGDIVENASNGTEYIQVGALHSIAALQVAAAAADARYSGRLSVFYTMDTDRAPLQGQTLSQLLASSREANGMIRAREYNILENGNFLPLDGPDNQAPLSSVDLAPIPLNNESYAWQRVGENPVITNATIVSADSCFFVEAPSGTTFEVSSTYLWQTEKFGSYQVRPTISGITTSGIIQDLLPGFTNNITHAFGYHQRNEFARGDWHVIQAQTPGTPKTEPPKPKPRKVPALHRGTVAPALLHMAAASLRSLGQPIHPLLPLLSVTSAAAANPGVHRLMAMDPSSLSNLIKNPALANAAAKLGPKAASSFGDSMDPKKQGGFNWKSLLSGAWDLLKIVGPALAKLAI